MNRLDKLHESLADQLDAAASMIPRIEQGSSSETANWEEVLTDLAELTRIVDNATQTAQQLGQMYATE